jgi:hypothetical protein
MKLRAFVHNVTVQVIERSYIRGLWNIFTETNVSEMSVPTIHAIAADTPETREIRRTLKSQVKELYDSLAMLRDIVSLINPKP